MNARPDSRSPARQLAKQLTIALSLFLLASSATAQTIKIATLAPEGTTWMNAPLLNHDGY